MKRYNNYHKHTHYSSIFTPDSEAKIKNYIDRAKELGHTTYFTTEHGYMGSIFEAYSLCEKNGLKCIAAMEGYIVANPLERDDANYHIMLIPTNNDSRKKLNKANSRANREGRYYKPRLFLEDLLKFSPDELYITNACVGGLLKDDVSFNNIMLPLINHFGSHFLIEVQSHNEEKQKELNRKALDIANRYNLRLIHANDSHYIYPEDSKYRDILLEGKGIKYEEETNFILDYPDYNTIVERYKIQGVLNENQIKEALDTTLIFDDINNLLLDKEIKMPNIYPDLSPEERLEKLKNIINENYKKIRIEDNIKPEENPLYIKAIREEFDVIQGTMEINTMDYFLLNYKLINLAIKKYNGVLTTTSRGSAGAFYINRLLGITQLDRIRAKIPLYYERFMSRSRLLENRSMPDCDFNVADPEPFRMASRELLGENGCHWMVAYGTMQESEAFRNLCRSKKIPFEEFNLVGKDLDKYRNDEKWKPIIDECQRFIGTIVSASSHPCSNLLYDKDLEEELGVIKLGDFYCCPITSSEADEWHYLKNDYLTVTTVDMTKKTFDLIGIPRMSLIELENALDDKVWDIYSKGLTCTVNQIDSSYATTYAMKYKPKSVYELAMLTGAIRPNFVDYRDDFVARKKYTNPVKKMDDLFASTNHFVLFQENLMQFFEWLGISPAKSIGLIKKISKKKIKKEDFDNLTVTLKENWIKENGSLDGFEETWEKIQSMISYGYNCVSGDTVILRPYNNGEYVPTIKEMYLIKNDKQYAKKTGHLSLHSKYRNYGFGNTFSIHENGNLYENKIYDIVFNGIRPIYLLTLENGKTIKCTMNHRFPTPSGNKMLSELKIGDILFSLGDRIVPRFISNMGNGNNYPKKGQQGFQIKSDGRTAFKKVRTQKVLAKTKCEICGCEYNVEKHFELHHIDGNRHNNQEDNLQWLCNSCHKKISFKNKNRTKKGTLPREAIPTKIKSIKYIGEEEVYDIQMDGYYHTWVANNGIVTHNSPHALAMAYDSLYNAYLKSHYPLEYYSVALNYYNGDEERTKKLISELPYFNISLKKPTFRYSKSTYFIDKETNTIYKGTSSIKFLNATASNYLYSLRDNKYNDFVDLLIQITTDKDEKGAIYINSRQIEILIKLQFFEEFGHNGKLLDIYKAFTSFYDRKIIKKDKLYDSPISLDIIAKNALTETDKQYRNIDIEKILHEYEKKVPNKSLKFSEQIKFEMEILGYINTTYPNVDKDICLVKDVDTKFTPKVSIYCLRNGKEVECKVNKALFKEKPLKKNDIIKTKGFEKKPKWIMTNGEFKKSPTEKEWHLINYEIVNEEELC